MKATLWFYGLGQSIASQGLPLQCSPYWKCRNDMPYWAWLSFNAGYRAQRRPT